MLHHILVKWNEGEDRAALLEAVRALFAEATAVPGVGEVQVIPNVIPRPNRYDLMIVLTLPADALPGWDASKLHRRWKAVYGDRIASKAIFDCEEGAKTL